MPRPRSAMHAYQETMAAWMTYRTGGKPWAGLGLGKTVATLTAIKDAREIFPTLKRAVVFGTRRIVEETWPDEIAAWDHIDFSYVVCTRALARREAAMLSRLEEIPNIPRVCGTVHHRGRRLRYAVAPRFAADFFDPQLPGSLTHFYHEMSRGQFLLTGESLPRWYTSSLPGSAYTATSEGDRGEFGSFVLEILA